MRIMPKQKSPRGKYPTLHRPMASDFSGVLGPATGQERFRYFVFFIDQLTKWPMVVSVKASTTDELIKSLETYEMPNHGYMETLVSGQEAAYTSNRFKEYAETRNIKLNPFAKGNYKEGKRTCRKPSRTVTRGHQQTSTRRLQTVAQIHHGCGIQHQDIPTLNNRNNCRNGNVRART